MVKIRIMQFWGIPSATKPDVYFYIVNFVCSRFRSATKIIERALNIFASWNFRCFFRPLKENVLKKKNVETFCPCNDIAMSHNLMIILLSKNILTV